MQWKSSPAWVDLCRPPGWQLATDFEVRFVPPGRPELAPLVEAAFAVEFRQICLKDNLSVDEQTAHYAQAAPFTWWILIIDQRGSVPIAAGAMRMCWLSATQWARGLRPPCVRDMAGGPWFADPDEVLAKTRRPDGGTLLDLLRLRGSVAIETVSVPAEHHRRWAAWIMYAALCRFSLHMDVGVWFAALDRLAGRAYWTLQRHLLEPFLPFFQGQLDRGTLAPGVYFANLDGDASKIRVSAAGESLGEVVPPNWTEQHWCDIAEWHGRLRAYAGLDAPSDGAIGAQPTLRRHVDAHDRLCGDGLRTRAIFQDLEPLRAYAPL